MLLDLGKKGKKRKKLVDMHVNEVSLVDNPANLIPFMIVKANKDKPEMLKADSLDINIKTNFTYAGTSLSVNGVEIGSITDAGFSMWKVEGSDSGKEDYISFSYGVMEDDENGANVIKRYEYRNKVKELNMDKDLEKTLTSLFGEIPDGFDSLDLEEQKELTKSLATIEEYADDMPPALKEAIGELILVKKDKIASIVAILEDAVKKIKDETDKKEDKVEDKKEEVKPPEEKKEEKKKDDLTVLEIASGKKVEDKKEEDKKEEVKVEDKKEEVKPPEKKEEEKKEDVIDLTQAEIDALADESVTGAVNEVLGE